MPRHSIEVKVQVTTLRKLGKSWGEIRKITGVSRSTAQSIVRKEEVTGSVINKKSCGRPKKLSERNLRTLSRIVSKNRRLSIAKTTKVLNESINKCVTLQTVRKYLRKNGWNRRCAAAVPFINRRNRMKRLQFCNYMMDFPWNRVVFSDEVRFGLESDGRIYVWRKSGERFNPACVSAKSNCKKSVMFWGCVTIDGTGPLIRCTNNMNSQEYVSVLEKASIQLLPYYNLKFQQDNAPIHGAGTVQNWFESHQVETIDWPSNSPDLNIIENIWSTMKRNLSKRDLHFCSITSLDAAVQAEWSKISIESIKKLYQSIPVRLKECKQRKGYATRF